MGQKGIQPLNEFVSIYSSIIFYNILYLKIWKNVIYNAMDNGYTNFNINISFDDKIFANKKFVVNFFMRLLISLWAYR